MSEGTPEPSGQAPAPSPAPVASTSEPAAPTPTPEPAAPTPTSEPAAPTPTSEPAAPTPTPEPAAAAADAPAGPPPQVPETTSPAGSGRAKKARPVTGSVLRAAAQTPADVRDLVVAERRAREAREAREAGGEPREPSDDLLEGLPPSKPGPQPPRVARVSRVKRRRSGSSIFASAVGEPRPEPAPAAAPPTATVPPPARPPALPTPPQTARPPVPVPAVVPPAAARPAPAPAPRPAPAPVAAPAPAPVAAPVAPRIEIHQPVAPIVVALLFGACMVALAALKGAQAVARELDEAAAARAAPALAPPPATPQAGAASGPQLAPLGNGRVVWATPDGRLVVLVPDPLSGELAVERVYAVVEDRERHLGDRDRRHLHGYYVDDLEAARRDALLGARARYEAAVDAAAHSPAELDHAEHAAEALVAAGGADILAPDLVAVGVGAQVTVASVRRRCAALALGEAGYLRAVRPLAEQLRSASSDYAARLVPLLARLTGLSLQPGDAGRALAAVDGWLAARPEVTGFERRPG